MRIAVNTRFLLSGKLEGVGWYTYEILQRMVLAHPEDEFIFIFDRPFDKRFIFADNITPKVLYPPARHPYLWYIWFEISLPWLLKKLKPDVFFSPDGYCSLNTKVPTLMTIHDLAYIYYPEQVHWRVFEYYKKYVPKYIAKANHIVTVSEHVKQDIINNLGTNSEKISVALNACRNDFKPIDDSFKSSVRSQYTNSKPYFLYYGAIHPRKNVLNLIKAFELFKESTSSEKVLLLVGRMAWQTDEVYEKLNNSPYKEDIFRIGYVDNELYKIVASADAVVYTSYFEGFGLPVLEAMASGVPVITSNVSSMPEVAGNAALTVDPYSVEEIANAMVKLSNDKTLQEDLITKGLQRSLDFSWDRSAETIHKLLKEISNK